MNRVRYGFTVTPLENQVSNGRLRLDFTPPVLNRGFAEDEVTAFLNRFPIRKPYYDWHNDTTLIVTYELRAVGMGFRKSLLMAAEHKSYNGVTDEELREREIACFIDTDQIVDGHPAPFVVSGHGFNTVDQAYMYYRSLIHAREDI